MLNNKTKNKIQKVACSTSIALSAFAMTITPTFAVTTGVENISTFVTSFIAPWLIAIGGIVALVGGIQFALGWQREDAEGKTRGLMTIMTGFMLVGFGSGGYALFTK